MAAQITPRTFGIPAFRVRLQAAARLPAAHINAMRRCILFVWAAAVRAEYFDVEEDAFWENDGPQEPRKTVKPKTTAPRIAKRDRAQLSLNQMVTFASQGWIRCVKCIPELRDPGVAAALDRGYEATLRQYARYAPSFMLDRFDVDVYEHNDECGPVVIELLDQGRRGVEEYLDRLRCSVRIGRHYSNVSLPYFQGLNVHRVESVVESVATTKALGLAAASLLQAAKVRLYQTAMFVKDPAHGAGLNNATGWHRDLQLVPLDTRGRGYVTFWCPYERPLGEGDSFLHFAVGSQRDIGFEYWYGNPEKLGPLIAARYAITRVASLDVGDCTAHDGWTFHTAPPQDPSRGARKVVAFSFVTTDAIPLPDLDAENIRVDRPDRVFVREDEIGWRDFYDELEPFEPVDHELLPMVFEDTRATNLPAPGGKQSLLNAARAAGANI